MDGTRFHPHRADRLNDEGRLLRQAGGEDLRRLFDFTGNEDVLDIGSGTGFYTDRIAALTTGTVYALDVQPEMHAHYRHRGVPKNVRLLFGDANHVPLAPKSVDVISAIATWHEISADLDLRALLPLLRPWGRLLIIDWRRDPQSFEGGPPLEIRSTKEEVREKLAPYFATIHAENLGDFMFAVTARHLLSHEADL